MLHFCTYRTLGKAEQILHLVIMKELTCFRALAKLVDMLMITGQIGQHVYDYCTNWLTHIRLLGKLLDMLMVIGQIVP